MIRFESEKNEGFSMLDKDAERMLKLMKHSGSVPGAIRAEDINAALNNLQAATESELSEQDSSDSDAANSPAESFVTEEQEEAISLNTRAYPLLQLLEGALEKQEGIMWDYDNGVI